MEKERRQERRKEGCRWRGAGGLVGLRDTQGNLLGKTLSCILKEEKMWSGEQGGKPSRRGYSRSKGLKERPGQGLEEQGGLEQAEKREEGKSEGSPVPNGEFRQVKGNRV